MLTCHGIPLSIYNDCHTIFRSPKNGKLSIEEQLQGKQVSLTQLAKYTKPWKLKSLVNKLHKNLKQKQKPGVLSNQLMIIHGDSLDKKHPGYTMMNQTEQSLKHSSTHHEPGCDNAVLSILNYCEHWDGTGYPQGLSGREIPKLARIIAVADYYDTLVSGSPCMKGISRSDAAARLREQAGIRFDPEIVELFLAH